MYQISYYSNKVKNTQNGVIFVQGDLSNQDYNDFLTWQKLQEEIGFLPYFPEEFIEVETKSVLSQQRYILGKIAFRALAYAMNRTPDDDLPYFEIAYRTKYAMCKGTKPDTYNSILQESLLEGYDTVELYKADVISKFEAGEQFRDNIIQLSEVVRKVIFKDMDQNQDFEKARQRLNIIDQIDNTQAADVIGLFQSAISL